MFMLTDWMAARMIELGWIQKLDHANMPNVDANLLPNLKEVAFDPGREYSVPWQSGFTGIAYNAEYVDEVRTFDELLTRPDLKGSRHAAHRDARHDGLHAQGRRRRPGGLQRRRVGPRRSTSSRLRGAAGQIRAFTGNEYTQDLAAGNIEACEAWSGDVIQLQFDNPNIKFVVPEEGLSLWSDNMMVPNLATHKTNAEEWMNYYYDPAVAAKLAAWVNYICPVEGARKRWRRSTPHWWTTP